MTPSVPFHVKNYDTRLDRFRVCEQIALRRWADVAGLARTQLNKYRRDEMEPRAIALAAMVRSAAQILERPVKASELYDVGEDEPVAPMPRGHGLFRKSPVRRSYQTRFDELLRRLGVPPATLAREAGISRQALRRHRMGSVFPVSIIRLIVSALRRMGYPVKASDLVDMGEE